MSWSLPRLEARTRSTEPQSPPTWLVPATIYAFSVSLGLLAAGLCLIGPLHGAGPMRLIFPQPAPCSW